MFMSRSHHSKDATGTPIVEKRGQRLAEFTFAWSGRKGPVGIVFALDLATGVRHRRAKGLEPLARDRNRIGLITGFPHPFATTAPTGTNCTRTVRVPTPTAMSPSLPGATSTAEPGGGEGCKPDATSVGSGQASQLRPGRRPPLRRRPNERRRG